MKAWNGKLPGSYGRDLLLCTSLVQPAISRLTFFTRQLDSFYAWRVFAAAYPNEMEETLRHRRQVIPEPNMPVTEYIKPICSVSYEWITFLALSHITCSRLDLVNISKLVNLGALTIGPSVETSDIGLDDRIIRTWGRAATESEAFSMLRVLACRSELGLTSQCFQHLSQFPSLALLAVENCSVRSLNKQVARSLGWRYSTGTDLGASLVSNGNASGSWDAIMRTLFYRCSNFGVAALTMEGVSAINSLPILHFSLGPTQGEAKVNRKDQTLLRFFERDRPQRREDTIPDITSKRTLVEPVDNRPVKRRGVTASRKQNFEDSLIEFGV